jgi:hypothetical protein
MPTSPSSPTSASEARDAAVATTTLGASPTSRAPAATGPVDGEQLCGLLLDADVAVLGQGFAPHASTTSCRWTDPAGVRALVIGSRMLTTPPLIAVQDYERGAAEPAGAMDLGVDTAGLVVTTSAVRTTLVVFTGDVRLDFDVPSDRAVAEGLARTAVGRLGPREPVAADP